MQSVQQIINQRGGSVRALVPDVLQIRQGGPASKYSRSCGQNEWCGGCDITPMTEQQAREWMEQNATADEYIEVFGEPEE